MRWLVGYIFDGWNSFRYAIDEIGKAIDRAWEDDA